jgi:WD40 repeat protein
LARPAAEVEGGCHRIAPAGLGHTVKVWDAKSGQELLTLREHVSFVTALAYGPDGHHIASASDDGTVKVWDRTPVTPTWQAERLALADRSWQFRQRQEAQDCKRQTQWFAALWHLNQLSLQNPDDADLRALRDAAVAEEERPR